MRFNLSTFTTRFCFLTLSALLATSFFLVACGEDDDDGDGRAASEITPRELEYLSATTENLKSKTSQLRRAWDPSGENFASEVANAGTSSTIYKSHKSAVQEMVNGMIVIADEVANGKISDPFNERDTTLVESQFSFNSIADFQDNIRGIQNVYMGKFTADGKGLNEFVAGKNSSLDSRFRREVQAAIDAIGAIPDPFRDSITANRSSVQAAIDAVSKVQQTLEEDILKLVLSSDFNDFDASTMLDDFANKVVLATYTDLDNKASTLLEAVRELQSSTTQTNLERAQEAWKAARRPWEQSEAFLFGPVDTQGLDPALDSWPVNRVDLDAVLSSGNTLSPSSIDGLEDTLKGFHTIEYLLFRN